ncbi:hypothetical protein E3N88_36651 [Mikania micrantha]|uniref:Uncharacterized protein n=1 Tax=Mikania micrantha TaxID=192012 RepID=A0A5N6M4V2_9ASTR|nr:hypothetical protein E3N88_36651 [Mikania micrantha]
MVEHNVQMKETALLNKMDLHMMLLDGETCIMQRIKNEDNTDDQEQTHVKIQSYSQQHIEVEMQRIRMRQWIGRRYVGDSASAAAGCRLDEEERPGWMSTPMGVWDADWMTS